MRNYYFPLPCMTDVRLSIREVFLELQYFFRGTGKACEIPVPVPPHWITSETVRELIDTYAHDADLEDLVPIELEEEYFLAIGAAWPMPFQMEPQPKNRRFFHALLFHIFMRERTGEWPKSDKPIQRLLELYDDPDHAEVKELPTMCQAFERLFPLVREELSTDLPGQVGSPDFLGLRWPHCFVADLIAML